MAKKKSKSAVEFPFYAYLKIFHDQNRKAIYASYYPLTRTFLRFNDPGAKNTVAYLRPPQFEALEIYVFLKEFLDNKPLYEIFSDWFHRRGLFTDRETTGVSSTGQTTMFGTQEFDTDSPEVFEKVYAQIKSLQQTYPNYIFALTMGLGKTVLMATSIFYEFLLANKFPKDARYCHNALVFAPDKTVLQSLKEIETFDKSRVVPPAYVNWLDTHLKFHFLDDTGISLNAIEHSAFNIVISNTQKIILKKKSTPTATEQLFKDSPAVYKAKSLNKDFDDLYNFDIDSEQELITNQRFAKLTRLSQLGVYVDEAHHVFGNTLAKDFGLAKSSTSLRITINELAEHLREAGSQLVGCYNYTGTPYVGRRLLPEVVYAFGLKAAIDQGYLKKVTLDGYDNIKQQTEAFVGEAIKQFLERYGEQRTENMLPKMAFFASSVKELQEELRPAVEAALVEHDIDTNRILVNVGDSTLTSNDDLREFRNLDTPQSDKQFILLVNKGKEGWNCRSLFSVVLHRTPKSRVFVLQATMRCLRAIGETQAHARVFLSQDSRAILEKELEENFRMSLSDLTSAGEADDKVDVEVRVVPPPVKIKLRRILKRYDRRIKAVPDHIDFQLKKAPTEQYRITHSERDLSDISRRIGAQQDVTHIKKKRSFSNYTLIAEIARYLNMSCLKVGQVLDNSLEGTSKLVVAVNEHNELLYDWIVPCLFEAMYEIMEFEHKEEEEVTLVNDPPEGFYRMKAHPELLVSHTHNKVGVRVEKSFHLDHYCFDSRPENDLFWRLLEQKEVQKVWFTGMLTHGQSDLRIHYIDPESFTVRSYYPDFLVQKLDDTYLMIEVKGDNMVDDRVVQAKAQYADQLATASQMHYTMVKGSEVGKFEVT